MLLPRALGFAWSMLIVGFQMGMGDYDEFVGGMATWEEDGDV
jgi:hypothetical protein